MSYIDTPLHDQVKLRPGESLISPLSINEMRSAIYLSAHSSTVTYRALRTSEREGLSGEDTMAKLAFFALLEAERLKHNLLRQYEMSTRTATVLKV